MHQQLWNPDQQGLVRRASRKRSRGSQPQKYFAKKQLALFYVNKRAKIYPVREKSVFSSLVLR
jgi:hypothetical protein